MGDFYLSGGLGTGLDSPFTALTPGDAGQLCVVACRSHTSGVMLLDGPDAGPNPKPLTAVIANVYVAPLVRSITTSNVFG